MFRLYRVIIPVSDIERAAEFYSSVFGMAGTRVSSGRHYFNLGGTILACFDPLADGDSFTLPCNPGHVYIAVSDLEGVYKSVLRTGCPIDSAIETQPWGERCFYAKDPFGNPLCFVDEQTIFEG